LDSARNTAIVKDDVPQKDFNTALLIPGPINIDIATGIKVSANGEWGITLLLDDGSMQAVSAPSIKQVMWDMPCLQLKYFLDYIKAEYPEN